MSPTVRISRSDRCNWYRLQPAKSRLTRWGFGAVQPPPRSLRTYAVGVLAGARGPPAPENLLFLPTCVGKAATGGHKKKGVLWRAKPSKPPNRVTPIPFWRDCVPPNLAANADYASRAKV